MGKYLSILKNNLFSIIIIVIILFIRLSFIQNSIGPLINGDETGYIINARRIFTHSSEIGNYPWGYSLVLSLAVILGQTPLEQYRLSLITNLVIFTLSLPLLYKFYKNLTNSSAYSRLFFLLTISYPAIVVYGGFALSENIFIWVQLIFLMFLLHLVNNNNLKWWEAILFTTITFYSFLIRENGILNLLLALITLYLFYKKTKREKLIEIIKFLLIFGTLFLITANINKLFFSSNLGTRENLELGTLINRDLIKTEFIEKFIATVAGQFFYLNYATSGLISLLISLSIFLKTDIRKWAILSTKNKNLLYLVLLSSLLFLLNLFFSSFFMSVRGSRGDHFIYGRYIEGYMVLLIVPTLSFMHNFFTYYRFTNKLKLNISIFVTLTTIICFFVSTQTNWLNLELNSVNVTSLQPLTSIFKDWKDYCLPLTLVYFLFFFWLFFKKPKITIVIIIFLLLVRSLIFYKSFYITGNIPRNEEREIARYILEKKYKVDSICYDKEKWSSWHLDNYRYFLPNIKFIPFSSLKDHKLDCSWIISGRMDINVDYPNAKLITIENYHNQALWYNNLNFINSHDVIDLTKIGTKYPESNYRSKIELLSIDYKHLNTSYDIVVKLKIQNLGQQKWFNLASIKQPEGSIRLGIINNKTKIISLLNDRCELPIIVNPGNFTEVVCYFKKSSPLPIKITLGLVHENVTWFYDNNDNVFELNITSYENNSFNNIFKYFKRSLIKNGINLNFLNI